MGDTATGTWGSAELGRHIVEQENEANPIIRLARKINPRNLGFSPKMSAIVGGIIGHDYGVRDRKGGQLGRLSITSDGFVIASSTAHESGAFVGDVRDLIRNLEELNVAAELTHEEAELFASLWDKNVTDWRSHKDNIREVIHEV